MQDEARAEIFKRKRGKNLALLAIILAFVALIFFITIAKIAHADEPAPDFHAHNPYVAGQVAHQAEMDADKQKFIDDAAQHEAGMKDKPQGWWQDWMSRHGL